MRRRMLNLLEMSRQIRKSPVTAEQDMPQVFRQMIDAALEIREIRQASKTKRTFEIANKSDLRFAVRPASYDYPMPVYAGQVLRIDITQGEEVEFTNCILGKGRYYTRIFWE